MNTDFNNSPLIAITMGDPAGIGPEIIVRGWPEIGATQNCRFVVVGQPQYLRRAIGEMELPLEVAELDEMTATGPFNPAVIECFAVGDDSELVPTGKIDRRAGRAACQFIDVAITATLGVTSDAIVTCPINKEAIQLGGCKLPGHTELLAARCGVSEFAMMLYIPPGHAVGGEIGLGVVHTTLHQSLRSALDELSTAAILTRIKLAHEFAATALAQAGIDRAPRIAVAALNPHAGEGGLFGDEETTVIMPAVKQAAKLGIDCHGPLPCDTLMGRAVAGEFDLVVAMYHDQGHIALKLLGMHKAVNVTLGLPIVRTSVAHGTGFEIAGTGTADCASLLRAVEVAGRLVNRQSVRCSHD